MTNRTDDFNRTDAGSLGTPSGGGAIWITVGGDAFGISSNKAYNTDGREPAINCLECDAADGTVQATLSTSAAGTYKGLVLRLASATDFIALRAQPTNWALYAFVGGSPTQIGSTYSATPADGDVMSVVASGTAIEAFINGVSRISGTSSSGQTNTKHGILTYADTTSRFDDWSWTDAGGGSSTIAADQGTFTHTGQTANLLFGRVLAADSGTFTNTGQEATLTKTTAYSLTADYGSFSLSGQDVAFQKTDAGSYVLTAEVGLFSLVGQGALASYSMNAEIGSFVIAGQEVTFSIGVPAAYSLTADAGSYSLTGQNARLDWSGAPIVPNRQAGIYMGMRIGL